MIPLQTFSGDWQKNEAESAWQICNVHAQRLSPALSVNTLVSRLFFHVPRQSKMTPFPSENLQNPKNPASNEASGILSLLFHAITRNISLSGFRNGFHGVK